MPIVISPDSELGKEYAKWNTPRNQPIKDSNGDAIRDRDGTLIMGKGAIGFEPYPRMLFKARQNPANGKPSVGEVPPHPAYYPDNASFERASLWVESFNRSCQMTVRDEESERIAQGQGWSVTQDAALELFEKEQQNIAQIAAEEAYKARRMSAAARGELADADASTHQHVTDVVGIPRARRGRPRKSEAVVAEPELVDEPDVVQG